MGGEPNSHRITREGEESGSGRPLNVEALGDLYKLKGKEVRATSSGLWAKFITANTQ